MERFVKVRPAAPRGRLASGRSPRRTPVILAVVLVAIAGLSVLGWWLFDGCAERRTSTYGRIVRQWAGVYSLPPDLIEAVITVESSGRARAVSKKGAKGLMQVTAPAEADVLNRFKIDAEAGDERLFDPTYNIRIGTAYLRLMIDRFGGDVYLALAAYNMGPTKLNKMLKAHAGVPARQVVEGHAPKETGSYCRKVFDLTEGRYATLPVTGS